MDDKEPKLPDKAREAARSEERPERVTVPARPVEPAAAWRPFTAEEMAEARSAGW